MHIIEALRPLFIKDTGAIHEGLLIFNKEVWIGGIDLGMNSCIHTDRIYRAGLNTEAAIDTEQRIDLVTPRKLFNTWI